jgi:hypothetical protein
MQKRREKGVIMDDKSDLMWQQLQARLDQRFGKYFKIDEELSEPKTTAEQCPKDLNLCKKITYYPSEHVEI